MTETEIVVHVASEVDVVIARQQGRDLAARLGFTKTNLALIATAISEIARNIVDYACPGEMVISIISECGKKGVKVVGRDHGPGIPDIDRAMQDGYSTGRGLGLGLPGARRLMDEFCIESKVGRGTTVTMKKWL